MHRGRASEVIAKRAEHELILLVDLAVLELELLEEDIVELSLELATVNGSVKSITEPALHYVAPQLLEPRFSGVLEHDYGIELLKSYTNCLYLLMSA